MAKKISWIILVVYTLFVGGIGLNVYRNRPINDLFPDPYSGVLVVESEDGQGSCFVVAKQGDWFYAITAGHVVEIIDYGYPSESESSFTVDDEEYEVEIVQIDSDKDIALIRFKSPETYQIYLFSRARVGESGTTVGWSQGSRLVYKGTVITTDLNGFVAVNGGVVPGCSGGPVLNEKYEVMGITVQFAAYRGQMFDITILYVPVRYAVALLIAEGIKEF